MRIVIAIFVLATALLAQMAQPHSSVNSQDLEHVAENTGIADAKITSTLTDCSLRPVRWQHMQGTLVLGKGKVLHEWWARIDPCQPRGTAALLCPNAESVTAGNWILDEERRATASALSEIDANGIKPHCGPKYSSWKTYQW